MKAIIGIILCICVGLFVGCASMGTMPQRVSKCDAIPEGESMLCQIAKENGVLLEDIGNSFRFANAIAIGTNRYTAAEAIVVAKALKAVVNTGGVTYLAFQTELGDNLKKYPGMLEVATQYFSGLGLNMAMKPRDIGLLNSWLDETIAILGG